MGTIMLLFLTSIWHPQNAHSYTHVLSLLEDTLRSVCNQTSDDFRVIVVCNDTAPTLKFTHPNIEFVTVHFPPQGGTQHTGDNAVRIDRGSKCAYGLWKARQYKPDHVMFFDCDDFVSNKIAAFVGEHKDAVGWAIDNGYEFRDDSPDELTPTPGWFDIECGTSRIIKFSLIQFPQSLPDAPAEDDILNAFGERYVTMFIGSHCHTDEFLGKNSRRSLPFPGAVYRINTGENHHVPRTSIFHKLNKLIHGWVSSPVPITEELRKEFTLPVAPSNA